MLLISLGYGSSLLVTAVVKNEGSSADVTESDTVSLLEAVFSVNFVGFEAIKAWYTANYMCFSLLERLHLDKKPNHIFFLPHKNKTNFLSSIPLKLFNQLLVHRNFIDTNLSIHALVHMSLIIFHYRQPIESTHYSCNPFAFLSALFFPHLFSFFDFNWVHFFNQIRQHNVYGQIWDGALKDLLATDGTLASALQCLV